MDVEVTTILNTDGSLDRIVEVRSDKELKDYNGLPFPVDSSWNMEYEIDSTVGDKKHIYFFKKHYNNVLEINTDYNT